MFILEKRLTIKIVVDCSLFIFWKRQNRVFFYTTIILLIVYFFERRNFLYHYYRISKFQLHTIWIDDEIQINTLHFSLLNFSNLNLYIFELFFWFDILHRLQAKHQTYNRIFRSIAEIFITNNEKKRLRKTVIIEQNSFWNDSIKTHIHKRHQHEHYVLFNDQNIFFLR